MSADQFPVGVLSAGKETASLERNPAQEAERLRSVAAQFEALLLGQLLKEMRASMFEEEDDESGFGGGPLADSLYSELSLALGRAGGLGLADALRGPLAREAGQPNPAGAAKVPIAGHQGTNGQIRPDFAGLDPLLGLAIPLIKG